MEHGVVGKITGGLQPDALVRRKLTFTVGWSPVAVAQVEGEIEFESMIAMFGGNFGPALLDAGKCLGCGDVGDRGRVVEPILGYLERCRETEDGPPALDGGDPAGSEGQAIANALNVVEDRDSSIAGAQEVRVQRVHAGLGFNCPSRGHECLPGHLPAEHTLAIRMGAAAPEDIEFDLLEVEEVQKFVNCGLGHVFNLPHRHAPAHRCCRSRVTRETRVRSMAKNFPEGFRWGTATAAHQVEGGNWNNDWWAWEHAGGSPCEEPSGDAVDQWHLYEQDIALCAALGFDNYRFSIEWSRIEPEPGLFSRAALDHYRRVCAACHAHGMEPVVTFHHFTTPRWVAAEGGWHTASTVDRFLRFSEVAVGALGDLIGRACTINEPNIVAMIGYQMAFFPPGVSDLDQYRRATDNFIAAHERVVPILRGGPGDFPVGLTLSMADHQAVPADDPDALSTLDALRRDMEDQYLDVCTGDDFLGVQTYSRTRVGPKGVIGGEPGYDILEMGYEFYPEALEACIRRAWEYTGGAIPLLVTENGIGTHDDDQRRRYVTTALEGVLACLADGIDVRGYTYWSLLDNFEWCFGYRPRFGIIDVDRSTQRRIVKPSGEWLGSVARANALIE